MLKRVGNGNRVSPDFGPLDLPPCLAAATTVDPCGDGLRMWVPFLDSAPLIFLKSTPLRDDSEAWWRGGASRAPE